MRNNLLSIQGESSYKRDSESHAIVNTDKNMLLEYKNRKKNNLLLKEMQQEINTLKEEIAKLKNHLQIR